jgi:adenylate cyclase
MDTARLQAEGLYDPAAEDAAERLALLEWLAAQGVTIDQMGHALREGSLLGLAGDLALRPPPSLTLEEFAARVGLPAEQIREISLASGLRPGAPGEREFSEDDVETLGVFAGAAAIFGATATKRFVRTLGSSLARLAEAAVSLYLLGAEGPLRASQASEVAIAQQNLRIIQSLDVLQVPLPKLLRAHLATAIRRQRLARHAGSTLDTLKLAVGFVDLVGFTALSRTMTSAELAEVIDRFEDSAQDIVAARDGRTVKLIGDEVMFVCVDAAAACDIALTLVERFAGDEAVTPRGGLAWGDMLFRGGDYYGPIVNTASRAAELAVPGELLVTPELAAQAASPSLHFAAAGRRMMKGFDEPVTMLTVARSAGAP